MSAAAADPADRHWMEQALALGSLGEGTTSPNPRVGCLVVDGDRPVGSGYHRAPGLAHAEAVALERAGDSARGTTLYVNLEPCAHQGRTPPCTDLLIRAGVKRVVASHQDPNPLVDGLGFAKLRAAGITVDVGVLEAEARRLNDPFLHFHRYSRPLVTIKAAMSLDGMISAAAGVSQWITEPPARRFAHRLRLRHDAVIVGAGTLRRDDPRLTVRLAGVTREIVRAVLSSNLEIDPASAFFGERSGPRVRIYTSTDAAQARGRAFLKLAEVVPVPAAGGRLDLGAVLDDLARCDVQSVLVEGGARTIGTFFDAGLADRAALFLAARLLGARGGTPLIDRPSVATPAEGWRVVQPQQIALGRDLVVIGRLARSDDAGG